MNLVPVFILLLLFIIINVTFNVEANINLDPNREGNGLTLDELNELQNMFNGIIIKGKYIDLPANVKQVISKMAIQYIKTNLFYNVGATISLLPKTNRFKYVKNLASILFAIDDPHTRIYLVNAVVKQMGKQFSL